MRAWEVHHTPHTTCLLPRMLLALMSFDFMHGSHHVHHYLKLVMHPAKVDHVCPGGELATEALGRLLGAEVHCFRDLGGCAFFEKGLRLSQCNSMKCKYCIMFAKCSNRVKSCPFDIRLSQISAVHLCVVVTRLITRLIEVLHRFTQTRGDQQVRESHGEDS